MFESEREVHIPTDEEEEEIQRQIAEDADAPEWTDEEWARAQPAMEVDPDIVEWSRGRRSPTAPLR